MPVKPRIKFAPGKTYVYSGSEGVYSVIAGELLEGDSVAAGGNLVYGAGAPSAGAGKDGDVYLDLTDFKVHTKGSGAWGSGSLFKGAAGTSGSAGAKGDTGTGGTKGDAGLRGKVTLEGSGAPGTGSNLATPTAALTDALTDASLTSGDLDLGDIYLDTTNHRFYKKTALGWATRGATFVGTTGSKGDTGTTGTKGDTGTTGTKGDAGLRGKVTLEGSGAPGTGSNLATPTAALTDALTDASLTSGDLDVGDLYLDTTNHRFYKKTALGWATRGLTFVGPTGTKGDTGTTGNPGSAGTKGDTGNTGSDGAGVNKYSSALTADTYLSTGSTASTSTTSGSALYPATLNLTDLMEDVGAVVTRSSITYNRSASATATGSRFSIASAGRYKIDCAATFNVTTANNNSNTPNLNIGIYYSTDSGSTWTALQTQTAAFNTTSSATAQTTLELSKTSFLPVGTKIEFRASRSSTTESTIVSVNAVTKTEVGEDTFVMFTKL